VADIELFSENVADSPVPDTPSAKPDKGMSLEDLEKLLSEVQDQPSWRNAADEEAAYYDNYQWNEAEIQELQDRTQPALTTNLIAPTINLLIGMEAKNRTDLVVKPDEDEDIETAEAMNVKYKEAMRSSGFNSACAKAYADQIKVGLGFMEIAWSTNPMESRYRTDYVHRGEIHWDWRARKDDLSDARYVLRRKWMDVDYAAQVFPKHAAMIKTLTRERPEWDPALTGDSGGPVSLTDDQFENLTRASTLRRDFNIEEDTWLNTDRKRVCIYEVWYRKWETVNIIRYQNDMVTEYDPGNSFHLNALAGGVAEIEKAVIPKVFLSWWAGPYRMYDVPSPYPHNYFPYIPFWGYREDASRSPYGLIRSMRSPQDEVNARRVKMMWLLSTKRVIMESDALYGSEEQVRAEVSRPDAFIILDSERPNKSPDDLRIETDLNLSQQQFQVLQDAKQNIQDVAGVYQSMLGQESAAESGVAIANLIEQGSTTIAGLNQNFSDAKRRCGELLLSLVKSDIGRNKLSIKVKQEFAPSKVIDLNVPTTDEYGNSIISNDISRTRLHVALEEMRSTPSHRAQQLQMLLDASKNLTPEVQGKLMPLVVQALDIPGRDELAEHMRQIAGLSPDVDKMSPEEKAAYEESMEREKRMKQYEEDKIRYEMELEKAKVEEIKARTISHNVEAAYAAMQAASLVGTTPTTAAAADEILAGAGWVDKNGPPSIASNAVKKGPEPLPGEAEKNTSPMFPPRPQTASVPPIPQGAPENAPPPGAFTGMETLE